MYKRTKSFQNEAAYSVFRRKKQPLPDPRTGLALLLGLTLLAAGLAVALVKTDRLKQIPASLLSCFGVEIKRPVPSAAPTPAADAHTHIAVLAPAHTLTPAPAPAEKKPEILIYHTHATEAYRKTETSDYKESGDCRTEDMEKSVVAVGAALAEALRSRGYGVLHDKTNHEPPKLATAYGRSVLTMERYQQLYPSITVFIDVHRDAYGKSPSGERDFVLVDGAELARIMFVVGTGKGATGTGFDQMPDFEKNYALASRITAYLKNIDETLVRDVRVKTGRYNQHISDRCLLVEMGHNQNTLDQALNAAPGLAEAIDYGLKMG